MGMMCYSIKSEELPHYADKGYIAENKFDGLRMVYRYGKFFTQDRKTFNDSRDVSFKFPELKTAKPINAVLDGEILCSDGKFESTGGRIHLKDELLIKINSKKNPVEFHIFDIIEINGKSCGELPLFQRKELLKSLVLENPNYKIVEFSEDIGKMWQDIVNNKGEGIVLKNKNSSYVNKRSHDWIKCKNFKEAIVTCESYDENPKGIAVMMSNGQRLQIAGSQSTEVKDRLDSEGSVKVEIQYLTLDSKTNLYRFPSYRGLVENDRV